MYFLVKLFVACPPNYVDHGGSCYSIFPILLPMSDSNGNYYLEYKNQICKNHASWGNEGHLVTISSEDENTLINRLVYRLVIAHNEFYFLYF